MNRIIERTAVDYLKDPDAIYQASFAAIQREANLDRLPAGLRPLAVRLIHALGQVDLADELDWRGDPAEAARAALAAGRPVLVDAEMVKSGIMAGRASPSIEVICRLNDARTPGAARDQGTTRSAAAVDLWRDDLADAVVAIGNAPTALFRLIEILSEPGAPQPAAIFGFPVGFVGAAESKAALMSAALDVPSLVLHGRRGGSALAAAAVNAIILEGAGP